MKIYYICECCEDVFLVTEADGPAGAITTQGICDDCAMEMGLAETGSVRSRQYYS